MSRDTSTSDLSPLTSDFDTTAFIYINYALPTGSLARADWACVLGSTFIGIFCNSVSI
ncbi:hypothetical protein J6590_101134 [Homalodisca vitripennis]|nr:hypothetical protein J6590_101134 [Homalodisca vitripennis]